jgi:tetratricopeptide (TPR) repeat protein
LSTFWYNRGHFQEALSWTDQVLALPPAEKKRERHRLACVAGELLMTRGEFERARALLSEALHLATQLDDPALVGRTWTYFGHLEGFQERFADAQRFYERALEHSEATGDILDQANARLNLGWALAMAGRLRGAREVLCDGLKLARVGRSATLEAGILNNLGHVALGEERFEELEDTVSMSCRLLVPLGEQRVLGEAFTLLSRAAAARGNDVRAARLCGAAAVIRDELGYEYPVPRSDLVVSSQTRLGKVTWCREFDRGKSMPAKDVVALGTSPSID